MSQLELERLIFRTEERIEEIEIIFEQGKENYYDIDTLKLNKYLLKNLLLKANASRE